MKVFISGPTEDTPLNRLRRFDEIQKFLEGRGYEIASELDIPYPALEPEINELISNFESDPDSATWLVLSMKKVWLMAKCDTLYLLPHWQECYTSIILFVIAKKLDINIFIDNGEPIKLKNEEELANWFDNQIE